MTQEALDDLVEMWHTCHLDGNPTLEDLIRRWTGWSHDEYNVWVVYGTMPKENND